MAWISLLLGLAVPVNAQVVTWFWVASGTGTTDSYNNPANWSGGVVPTNDGNARLQLPTATGPEVMLLPNGALALNSLYLELNSYYGSNYRFGSAGATTLSLAAGITSPNNGYSRSVQFDAAVSINLTADQTWTTSYTAINGAIGGPGKLTFSPHYYYSSSYLNEGYLELNGPGNFTGGLAVHNTTIVLGHAQALEGSGEVLFSNVLLQTPLALTLGRSLTVAGTISHYRSGEDSSLTLAGPITLLGNTTFEHYDYSAASGASPMLISGNITESAETSAASLTMNGSAIVLAGTNTYTGATTVNGRAIFANAQAVAPATTIFGSDEGYAGVAFTSGVQAGFINHLSSESFDGTIGFDTLSGPTQVFAENLDLSGLHQYFGLGTTTSAVLAGTIHVGAGNDYRFGIGGGTLAVTSALTGSGRILVNHTGYQAPTTVVLQGNNTATGGVEVNGGAVVFDSAGALPATGSVTLTATGSPMNLAYAGITEGAGLTPNQFLARLDLRAVQAIVGLDSAVTTSPRTITEAIDLSLGQQEGVTRTTPYFLGTTTKVILAGPITTGGGSTPLQLTGFKGGELVVDSVLGAVIPSVVIGLESGSSIIESLTGTVRLNGANTYASGTLFQSGVLALGHDTALGTGGLMLASNGYQKQLLFADGLTLANGIQGEDNSYQDLNLGTTGSTASLTLTGGIADRIALRYLGSGTLTYAGTNPHLGSLTTAADADSNVIFNRENGTASQVGLMSGQLTVNATTEVSELTTQTGTSVEIAAGKTLTLGYNNFSEGPAAHEVDGAVTGAGALRIMENSAALTGANNFSGGLELADGTVGFVDATALGTGAIRVSAASSGYSYNSLVVLAPDQTITNAIELQTSASAETPTSLTFLGSDRFSYDDYAAPGNRDLTVSGAISGTGTLHKQSGHTLTLTGTNTFTGDISVEAGTLVFSTPATTGALTNRLHVGGYSQGATAYFPTGNPQVGALVGYGYYSTSTVELGDGVALTIGVHDHGETGNQAYFGNITGNGSIIKDGPASQTFAGANDYTGGTTVKQGTLVAGHNQAFGTGAVTLDGGRLAADYGVTFTNPIVFGQNGGVLSGNGTFSQALTIGPGVGLAPGYSPGAMTFADLTLGGGGFLEFEIADPTGTAGSDYDTLNVSGTLAITANAGSRYIIHLTSLDANWHAGALDAGTIGTTYTLTLATSANLTGFNPANFQIDASNFTVAYAEQALFSISASGNDIVLNFTPVPEPSTYALLALGAGLLWLARRRRC